jgi:hypothetical protein
MIAERRFIIAETYIISEGDLSTKLDPDIRWEALEYNPYKKVFVPASSASSREELLSQLDRDFNGGTKEDKIRQKIRDLDPDVLKDYLDRLEKLESTVNGSTKEEVAVDGVPKTAEVSDKKTKPQKETKP